MITALDHANIRTGRLDLMVEWYSEVLGLSVGPRPPFSVPGAWMYAGDEPIVHLVGCDPAPGPQSKDLTLEHAAFRARGMKEFLEKLDARGERYELFEVPEFPIVQVNIWDPDGNHLHVDFHADEAR